VAGFVNLGWAVNTVLETLLDGGEAALKGDFYLSNRGVDGVIDCVEELGELVNAQKGVGVEDERNNDFAGIPVRCFKESV
jgi:hypothetical protein